MITLSQLREGIDPRDEAEKHKSAVKKHVRDAMHGHKPLSDTKMTPKNESKDEPQTPEEKEKEEAARQREHDALVAQEKGETGAGKGSRWKVRQWYGKYSLKHLKDKLGESIDESSGFREGLPKRYGGEHGHRTYSPKYDDAYHSEVPEEVKSKVDPEAAEHFAKNNLPKHNTFDKVDSIAVHKKKDQNGTHYFGVYGYTYGSKGGQKYHSYVSHHLGTVNK